MDPSAPMTDMNTGAPVSFEVGSKWKCIDLSVEEKYFSLSLLLENRKGEKIPLPLDDADNTDFVFDAKDAGKYRQKYGHEKWDTILQGEVVVGFTEEMVLLSWGKPKSVPAPAIHAAISANNPTIPPVAEIPCNIRDHFIFSSSSFLSKQKDVLVRKMKERRGCK